MPKRTPGRDHRGIRQPTPQGPWEPSDLTLRRRRRRERGPLRRSVDNRMIAGVAGGLSRRLGIDATLIRVAFVLLALGSGTGLALYVLAWFLLPLDHEEQSIAARALSDPRGIALAVAFLPGMAVVVALASALGIGYVTSVAGALFVAGAGLVLIYRNAGDQERQWLRRVAEPALHIGVRPAPSRRALFLRVLVGVALAVVGLVFLVHGHTKLSALGPLTGAALVMGAVVVVFGPWWLRIGRDLVAERQARVRAEERSEMAARVHDSVLQTLALIQRSCDDPQRVTQLARSQERELRSWLFEGVPPGPPGREDPGSVAATMEAVARQIEEVHGTRVDSVTVGDCALDDDLRALVAAASEATANAAKWSGAGSVSIFTEVEGQRVSIFVRDRGAGFDRHAVAPDRRGISGSIEERMRRQGGASAIRSRPGQGTEVELVMPRRAG
jgi:signal transduction histidine kinase